MNGRGGFRDAGKVTMDDVAKFMPQDSNEEESDGKGRKKIPKSKDLPVKKLKTQKDIFETEQEEEKIPLSAHKEKMSKLQQKYDKLEEKEKSSREENKKLKSSLAKMEKSYEVEKGKKEELNEKYNALHDSYELIGKELKTLRRNGKDNADGLASREKEIDDLRKDLKKKEKEITSLESKMSDLEKEKESLKRELTELKMDIENNSADKGELKPPSNEEVQIISRVSNTRFQSSSFTGTRYKVSLSRDCSIMTFKVDILGSATCINGIIELPSVSKYLPFTAKRDYPVEFLEDGRMLIRL